MFAEKNAVGTGRIPRNQTCTFKAQNVLSVIFLRYVPYKQLTDVPALKKKKKRRFFDKEQLRVSLYFRYAVGQRTRTFYKVGLYVFFFSYFQVPASHKLDRPSHAERKILNCHNNVRTHTRLRIPLKISYTYVFSQLNAFS